MTTFLMAASNQKLIVIHSYSMITTLGRIIELISIIALVVFALASFTYRMIAI